MFQCNIAGWIFLDTGSFLIHFGIFALSLFWEKGLFLFSIPPPICLLHTAASNLPPTKSSEPGLIKVEDLTNWPKLTVPFIPLEAQCHCGEHKWLPTVHAKEV